MLLPFNNDSNLRINILILLVIPMWHKTVLLLIMQIGLLLPGFSQTNEQLRANLYSFNTDNTLSLADGNLTMYAVNNSNVVDRMDAVKISNFGENFGLQR